MLGGGEGNTHLSLFTLLPLLPYLDLKRRRWRRKGSRREVGDGKTLWPTTLLFSTSSSGPPSSFLGNPNEVTATDRCGGLSHVMSEARCSSRGTGSL